MDSILDSTKRILGIDQSDTSFNVDIVTHINAAFSTLNQLGVGPVDGFFIEDETSLWSELLITPPELGSLKSYVYLYVRMKFDPPSTSFHINAMEEQIRELEWRLNFFHELSIPLPVEEPVEP